MKEDARRPPGRTASLTLLAAVTLFAVLLLLGRLVSLSASREPERAPSAGTPTAVEFDRFSARVERAEGGDRLSVSLRLRATARDALRCFTFVVARNDAASPRRWSIWPPQPAGAAITAGGHFHGADPSAGFPLTLNDTWQRITATVASPSGPESYDTVVVYVLSPRGKVLLARPFRV